MQGVTQVNLGVPHESPLKVGHGFIDYLLYINDMAAVVIVAKKPGAPLTSNEIQSEIDLRNSDRCALAQTGLSTAAQSELIFWNLSGNCG